MSEETERLERELLAAQEMLYLVLDAVGEPVRIPAAEAKDRIKPDHVIDVSLEDDDVWVFSVKEVNHG